MDQPTDWVNSPRDLNNVIKREHYKIPIAHEVALKLTGKKVFSILDEKDGFWQIPLYQKGSFLCTFNSPFGRYCFLRCPFGISSAPEIFQKRSDQLFGDINPLATRDLAEKHVLKLVEGFFGHCRAV